MALNETSLMETINSTMTTSINGLLYPKRHVTLASQTVLTVVYICGVIGNISALVTLFYKDKVCI